jgi:hypothetical protein
MARQAGDCEVCGCYANPPATLGDPWKHRTLELCLDALNRELLGIDLRRGELLVKRETIAAIVGKKLEG